MPATPKSDYRERHGNFAAGVLVAACIVGVLVVVAGPAVSPAEDFDWRNISGQNFVTPVRNQGSAATCWAFAAAGVAEAQYLLTRGLPSLDLDLSEQHLVCSGSAGDAILGGNPDSALNYVRTTGIVTEQELPYTAGNSSPNWPLQTGWQDRVLKIASNRGNLARDPATVKAYLKLYGPLLAGFQTDIDWYPPPGSRDLGHAAVVTGFHDATTSDDAAVQAAGGYYIVKNSWGAAWNGDGYGKILYTTLGNSGRTLSAVTGPASFTGALATATWNATGSVGTWSSGGDNWVTTGSPYAWENLETAATFTADGAKSVSVSGIIALHALSFSSGATGYSLSDGTLNITGGGITANESVAIGSAITIGASQAWTVAAGKTLTLGGAVNLHVSALSITGDGDTAVLGAIGDVRSNPSFAGLLGSVNGSLTKGGSGTLTLGGLNAYTGATTVNGGTLRISNALALQNTPVALAGGMLDLNGLSATLGGLAGTQPLAIPANQTLTVAGNGSSTVFAGNLSGNGAALVKSGTGLLVLSGSNTYTGGSTATGGMLTFANSAALPPSGSLTAGSGGYLGAGFGATQANFLNRFDKAATCGVIGLESNPAGPIDLSQFAENVRLGTRTAATLSDGNAITPPGDTYRFGGGGGTLTVNCILADGPVSRNLEIGTSGLLPAGTVVFDGSNSYSGDLRVRAGVLSAATLNNPGNNGPLGTGGNPIALGDSSGTTGTLQYTGSTVSTNRTFTLAAGGGAFEITSSATLLTLSGPIDGAGGLNKLGNGSVVLNGINSYSGGTTVGAGILSFARAEALPAIGTITAGSGGYAGAGFPVSQAGFLDRFNKAATVGVIGLEGDPSGPLDLTGFNDAVRLGTRTSATIGAGNAITLSGSTYRLGGGGGTLTVNCPLTDGSNNRAVDVGTSGSLPPGTVIFSAANDYHGTTSINAGTLRLGLDEALPSGSGYGSVSIATGATLDLAGHSQTLNRLSGYGTIDNSSGVGMLTIGGSNATSLFWGTIQNSGGTLGLTKIGSGTFTLGFANSYSGDTIIQDGALRLQNGASLPSAVIDVQGGTLNVSGITGGYKLASGKTLKGDGRVWGATTASGTVAPGESPGTLTVDNMTFASGSRLAIELAGRDKGVTYDLLKSLGTVTLQSGSEFDVTLLGGFTPADGDVFDVLDFSTLSGRFDVLDLPPLGGSLSWDASQFYTSGTLSVTPEPAAVSLVLSGVVLSWFLARRRGKL